MKTIQFPTKIFSKSTATQNGYIAHPVNTKLHVQIYVHSKGMHMLEIQIYLSVCVILSELLVQTILKVSKGAKTRNRYNQVPQLTQDTNGKVTNSQLDTTNESQEVSPFPAGDHKAMKYNLKFYV